MFCPYCGGKCEDNHKFCFHCGSPLPQISADTPIEEPVIPEEIIPAVIEDEILPVAEEPVAEETPSVPEPAPMPRRMGKLWPPVLILVVLSMAGLLLFSLTTGGIGKDASMPWFQVKNGTLYFDTTQYTGSSELTVPSSIDGQTVTALSDTCFANCTDLTTVILPDTLEKIGNGAFAGCHSMRGIYIPENVHTIGKDAFLNCMALEAVSIPASATEIGTNAFLRCNSLQFIFYGENYEKWAQLYTESIHSEPYVYCADGVFRHGSTPAG